MNAENFRRAGISFFFCSYCSQLLTLQNSCHLSTSLHFPCVAASECQNACNAHRLQPNVSRANLSSLSNCSCSLCHFPLKCDLKACAAASGVVGGCSPEAVFLSHVNKLVCVRVWGAVVVRSLHVFDPSSPPGLMDGWMDGWMDG